MAACLAVQAAQGQCHDAKLTASHGSSPYVLGWPCVAIDEDRVIIGAGSDNANGHVAGSAYIYGHDGWAWHQEAKLLASDGEAQDMFGESVSLSGDVAVVGSRAEAAYVFRFDEREGRWLEEAKLTASDGVPGDDFGNDVRVSGDVIVVGAREANDPCGQDGCAEGAAYVFRFDGSAWIEEVRLEAPEPDAGDYFGGSVAVDGDVVMISAFGDDDNGVDAGAVYAYRFNADRVGWVLETKLLASDGASGAWFSGPLSISDDVALVGSTRDDDNGKASGSAYVFRYDPASQAWTEEAKLLPSDGANADFFGSGAIHGDVAVVGARGNDDRGSGSGSAYVFRCDPVRRSWIEEAKLIAVDGAQYDGFGATVAIDGDLAIVGAKDIDEIHGLKVGAGYIYRLDDLDGPDCDGNGTCDAIDLLNGADDCNGNSVPDECDVTAGQSDDCNANGAPDDCEFDCNVNGAPDDCDLAAGRSEDCNANGVPDECELDYVLDDGSEELQVGTYGAADAIWLNGFTVEPGRETIAAVGLRWGYWVSTPGPTTVLLYSDPTDEGDPTDGVLLQAVVTESVLTGPEQIVAVPIPPTFVGRAGERFFVGATITTAPGQYPMSVDSSSPYQNRSWYSGAYPGEADLENLGDNLVPPRLYRDGNWIVRALSTRDLCCPADVDGDCDLDHADLGALIKAWGACPDPPQTCPADLDGDGAVTTADLLALLAAWG